jgi:hypothetical protein
MISTLIHEPARIASMRTTPDGRRRLLAQASVLVARCQKLPALVRRHWRAIQKMTEEVAWPVDDLKPYFLFVLSLTDVCLGMAEAIREGLKEAHATSHDLSALADVAASLRSFRDEASAVSGRMEAPPAKRKLRTTAEIRAARARGEYMSGEEAMTRARGGSSGTS